MPRITPDSLMSLEAYAKARPQFRAGVIEHKKNRAVRLGDHLTLIFEDELTIRYQVQEMLRAERIFEERGILDELEAYNPLVPDGRNWKATLMIEYPDAAERERMLKLLIGIEDGIWVRIGDSPRVYAIADEDLDRDNAEKTSAVHFLRFELESGAAAAVKRGERLSIGVDHPAYRVSIDEVSPAIQQALAQDLQ